MADALIFQSLQSVVCYPVSRGKLINCAIFDTTPGAEGTQFDGPWVTPTTGTEVAEKFASWSEDIRDLIKVYYTQISVV